MIDYLLYTNEVDEAQLRSLAIQAFVVNEDPELTQILLSAWLHFQENEEKTSGFSGIGHANCDSRYELFLETYRENLGQESYESVEPDWPDGFLPRWFVEQVAIITGQQDKASMQAYRQINDAMDRDKKTLSAEKFKSKHGFLTAHFTKLAITSLELCRSRTEAARILDAWPTKRELESLARQLDLPVRSRDTIALLQEKIIEGTIGFRLRSKAVRGTAN